MKKTFLTLAIALTVLSVDARSAVWEKTIAAAQKKAQAEKKLIFVDLFAEWCGWCHKAEREIFPSDKFRTATKDMVLLKLDTEDGKEGTMFSQKMGVNSLPTFLVLTEDLMLAGTIKGYAPTDPFVVRLKAVEKDYRAFQDRLDNEKAIALDYRKRIDLSLELLQRRGFTAAETRLNSIAADRKASKFRDEAIYHVAMSQFTQEKFPASLITLAKLDKTALKGEYAEKSALLRAQIYLRQRNYKSAIAEYRQFKTRFPSSPAVPEIDGIMPQLEDAVRPKAQ